jgi:hypothetical protein
MHPPIESLSPPVDPNRDLNLWSFFDLDEEAFVPCKSARWFLMYLLSPRTTKVERTGLGVGFGKAQLLLYGPVTDDCGNLVCEYTLTRKEVQALDVSEKRALRDALRERKLSKDPSGIQTRKVLDELGIRTL